MNLIEERRIRASEVRSICIKMDWYTHGTCSEYEEMFKLAESGKATPELIWLVAKDIADHSDMEHYRNSGYSENEIIENVMCYIANDALVTNIYIR